MHSRNFDYDVIIVGAGISGLSAGYAIHERDSNISLLILEGNDRIGGRTLSVDLNDGKGEKSKFDIGGQFVCNSQTHLMSLLKKLDIEIEENNNNVGYTIGDMGEGRVFTTKATPPIFGDAPQSLEIQQFLSTLEILSNRVSLENPTNVTRYNELDSTTMEVFMYNHLKYSISKQYMRILVKTICGVEPSDISVLFFLCYCNSTEGVTNTYLRSVNGGKGAWIKNGSIQICEKIANIIGEDNVKINSAVTQIQRNDTLVLVRTAEQEYKCQYVILAVPPKHLAKVQFVPPLSSAKRDVLKKMHCRSRIKFIVTYKSQFWRTDEYNGDIYCLNEQTNLYPIMWAYNISTNDNAVITGLLDAEYYAKKISFKEEVLRHLEIYFGKEALQPLDYVEKFWSPDEHIFDEFAICFPVPKIMQNFHELRRPLGRLYFAGTETATYWYGHMAGAAQSGFRAAVEVLYELRPQCLTSQDFTDLKPRRRQVQFYASTVSQDPLAGNDWIIVLFVSTIVSYLLLKIFTILSHLMRIFSHRTS